MKRSILENIPFFNCWIGAWKPFWVNLVMANSAFISRSTSIFFLYLNDKIVNMTSFNRYQLDVSTYRRSVEQTFKSIVDETNFLALADLLDFHITAIGCKLLVFFLFQRFLIEIFNPIFNPLIQRWFLTKSSTDCPLEPSSDCCRLMGRISTVEVLSDFFQNLS